MQSCSILYFVLIQKIGQHFKIKMWNDKFSFFQYVPWFHTLPEVKTKRWSFNANDGPFAWSLNKLYVIMQNNILCLIPESGIIVSLKIQMQIKQLYYCFHENVTYVYKLKVYLFIKILDHLWKFHKICVEHVKSFLCLYI